MYADHGTSTTLVSYPRAGSSADDCAGTTSPEAFGYFLGTAALCSILMMAMSFIPPKTLKKSTSDSDYRFGETR